MRDLKKTATLTLDPWTFARQRQNYRGNLLLANTKALQEWAGNEKDTVDFEFFGDLDEYGQLRFAGTLQVVLHTQCQRCLEQMLFPIQHRFDYVLIRHQDQEENIVDGSESFICAEDELDLAWFIEEEILLAMPMIAKHENCTMPQMTNEAIPNQETPQQNPFAQLKDMIKVQETTHGSSTKS